MLTVQRLIKAASQEIAKNTCHHTTIGEMRTLECVLTELVDAVIRRDPALNPAPLEILRRALESIRSIDCHCGLCGPCGCGEEAVSIADDALQDVYGCPRCFGVGDISDGLPSHVRHRCPLCGGCGLLSMPYGTEV